MEERIIKTGEGWNVRLVKSSRYRTLTLSVRPFEGIVVTMPAVLDDEQALRMIQEKSAWIQKNRARVAKIERQYTEFTNQHQYHTRAHRLILETHDKGTIRISVANGIIRIKYPGFATEDHPKVQEAIRKGVEEAWRIESHSWLPQRTKELAAKYNFSFQKVTIRNSRTRWGSCTWDNKINLSLHLMMLPDHLIDYVILHELAHTVHKNHGPLFWQLLDRITGGVDKLEKEIDNYHIGIY